MLKTSIAIFLVFVWAASFAAFSSENLKTISNDPYWKLLLYYENNTFGGYSSKVDTHHFFFHPQGNQNSLLELKATIKAFQNDKKKITIAKIHTQCAFPERFKFLSKKLPSNTFKRHSCPQFNEWKKALSPKSISLVFSTAYSNNPSSMFGHTLLKFNKHDPEYFHKDLLNYSAAFGANVDPNDSTLLYAIKGMLGKYRGVFTLDPYYVKVTEYINGEARDLWDYELNLSKDKMDSIINHLWELYANANFNYFFFDENCSYYLSRLLDLAFPELWNSNYTFFVLPSDIVKRFAWKKNLIKKIRFRPSALKQFLQKFEILTKEEKKKFNEIINSKLLLENNSYELLEAIIKSYDYIKFQKKGSLLKEEHQIIRKTLLQISKTKIPTIKRPSPSFDKINQPDKGHRASRVGLWATNGNQNHLVLEYKAPYHDLMDMDAGFERYSQIDLMKIKLGYNFDDKKIKVHNAQIVEITSHPKSTILSRKYSYELGARIGLLEELRKYNSNKLSVQAAGGINKQFFDDNLLVFLMAGLSPEYSPHFKHHLQFSPYLTLGFIKSFKKLKVGWKSSFYVPLFYGTIKEYYFLNSKIELSLQLTHDWMLRYSTKWRGAYGEIAFKNEIHSLGLLYYY